jgi:hypothetical protein
VNEEKRLEVEMREQRGCQLCDEHRRLSEGRRASSDPSPASRGAGIAWLLGLT